MDNVVIFGASGGAIKVASSFNDLGIQFKYFVDNDKNKWGTKVLNKDVKSPDVLKDDVCNIIIASVYQEEIEAQLKSMEVDLRRVVPREKYIFEWLESNIQMYKSDIANINFKIIEENISEKNDSTYLAECNIVKKIDNKSTYIIDLAEGMSIGGIESYSFNLAESLNETGKNVFIFSKITDDKSPLNIAGNVKQLDITFKEYRKSIDIIISEMKKHMPFTIICNWMTQNFVAAYILKQFYNEQVKIIGVQHHDMLGYYKRNKFLEDKVDAFVCVSDGIRKRLAEEFKVNKDKVFFKPVPIKCVNYEKAIQYPVNIAFGARLVKTQKRADLIIPLIKMLEDERIDYKFHIAGAGKYFDIISDYISKHSLEEKVLLYGALPYENMTDFWKKADIVVSLSDSEGMGLSILEAMACGAVPVVTDTAGIRDFVLDGENGFVADICDLEQIKFAIVRLCNDLSMLERFSKKAKEIINQKCLAEKYIRFLDELC